MDVKIKETGEIKQLEYTWWTDEQRKKEDYGSPIDTAADLIQAEQDDDGYVSMSEQDYEWWTNIFQDIARFDDLSYDVRASGNDELIKAAADILEGSTELDEYGCLADKLKELLQA